MPVWTEEFNGGLDCSQFPVLYGGRLYQNGAFRWDSSAVSFSGGSLHITLDKQADGIWRTAGLATMPPNHLPHCPRPSP